MTQRYGLNLDLLIRLESEGNMHDGWRRKAERTATNRMFAKIEVLSKLNEMQRQGLKESPTISVTLTRVAPRSLDSDNLPRAFKAVRDGIADAVGIDDRSTKYLWIYDQRKGKAGEYMVEIRMSWEA